MVNVPGLCLGGILGKWAGTAQPDARDIIRRMTEFTGGLGESFAVPRSHASQVVRPRRYVDIRDPRGTEHFNTGDQLICRHTPLEPQLVEEQLRVG